VLFIALHELSRAPRMKWEKEEKLSFEAKEK
jgi:hypothetical protein